MVAVADSMDCPALFGTDLGGPLTRALMEHVIAKTTQRAEKPIEASPSSAQPSVSVDDGQNEVHLLEASVLYQLVRRVELRKMSQLLLNRSAVPENC